MNNITERLEALEKRVANQRDWKQRYDEEKDKWDKERETLLKSLGVVGKLKEIFSQFLGLDSVSTPPQQNVTKGILNLNHEELAVNLTHNLKEINKTTGTVVGQILFCALTELPKDGFTEAELTESLKEHGWNVGRNTLAPTLGGLVKDGSLIRLNVRPAKYRLPHKVKMNVLEGNNN